MSKCEVCGNDYDKSFSVTMNGITRTFDSFECAIQAMAPTCTRCGVRVVGHGAEAEGKIYCGANCASKLGVEALTDRV